MDTNRRPDTMERITTPELAKAFIDEQIAAVKTQIAMVRGEIYEVKDMLMTIMERLGMGRHDFNQDDRIQ